MQKAQWNSGDGLTIETMTSDLLVKNSPVALDRTGNVVKLATEVALGQVVGDVTQALAADLVPVVGPLFEVLYFAFSQQPEKLPLLRTLRNF